jgi:Tol biopolymer transport system component/DNA-binding winged helix-turn-helix (wHTH) protein
MASAIEIKSFVFRFADVTVREREFAIAKAGNAQQVEPKAFQVLLILIRNPNQLIAKEELLSSVWGETAVTENSLARNIALLRRLLGDDPRSPRFIETVSSIGYRFICPVEATEEPTENAEAARALNSGDHGGNGRLRRPDKGTVTAFSAQLEWESDGQLLRQGGHKTSWFWLPVGGVLAIAVAAGTWFSVRSLPPPTVSAYRQITSDGGDKELAATDGPRIYFNRNHSVRHVIFEVPVSGGNSSEIPIRTPEQVTLYDISPDGSKFLVTTTGRDVTTDRPQWFVRMVDGIPVLPLPEGSSPAISPDGESVVYAGGDASIWLVGSNGAGAHKMASTEGTPCCFAWSPDGTRIRFGLKKHLWEIRSDGSNLHPLLSDWRDSPGQCCGRWTADGSFYIFLSQVKNSISQEIWALDERHGLFRRLPSVPIRLATGPINWTGVLPAKDAKTLFATGEMQRGELSRLDIGTRQFQPFLGGISVEGPKFSPDGRSVVYVSWPEQFLFRANADGSNPVQLTDARFAVFLPSWSPDGTQIVFTDVRSDPSAIYVIPATGGAAKKVILDDREPESDPTWSQDGKKIAFDNLPPERPKYHIRVADLSKNTVSEVPGSTGTFSPRWSPDGRYIAAIIPGELTLTVFDTRTQTWKPLVEKTFMGYPNWSSNSRWLYYLKVAAAEDHTICRVHVPDGKPEVVVNLPAENTEGWWGWFGLDATDAPMIMRDIGRHEIYALTLSHE